MGHELERLFVEAGDEVVTKIDNEEDWKNQGEALRTADVAVEFSMPTTAVSNLFRCFDAYVPVVCGTTGWANDADKVLEKCKATSNALVYGANFSIGANLFFKINELLAKMMNSLGAHIRIILSVNNALLQQSHLHDLFYVHRCGDITAAVAYKNTNSLQGAHLRYFLNALISSCWGVSSSNSSGISSGDR